MNIKNVKIILLDFVDEKIEQGATTDKISKTNIQEEFKIWYEMEFGKKPNALRFN